MKRAILTAALLLALPFSAHGVIGIQFDNETYDLDLTGETTGAVVYAKETLSKSNTIKRRGGSDVVTYYVVSESNRIVETGGNVRLLDLDVYVPFPFALPVSSTMVVTLTLEDMILGRNLDLSDSSSLTNFGYFELRYGATYAFKRGGLTYTLRKGGLRGDSEIGVSLATGGSTTISTTDSLYVSLGQLGILPDTPGTIRVKFTATGEEEREYVMRDAVKAVSLLEVESTASNPTVDLVGDGAMFEDGDNVRGDGLAANVGKVKAEAAMTFTGGDPYYPPFIHPGGERVLAASGALIIEPTHSFRTTSPYYTGPGATTYVGTVSPPSGTLAFILGSTASIEIEGDTDFLGEDGKLYVSPNANCEPSRASLIGDEDEAITAPLAGFAGVGGHVCLEVDGETPIPQTTAYTATLKQESTTAAFPIPDTTVELGRITLGGATVKFPFLTTDEGYNNRIVLVNRANRPVPYNMTFLPSEGVTATPKDAATGELPVGRTILQVRDVVTINDGSDDGGRSAALLTVRTSPSTLDVATVSTNRLDGSTDTVVHDVK